MRYLGTMVLIFFLAGCWSRGGTPKNIETVKSTPHVIKTRGGVLENSKDPEELADALIALGDSKTLDERKAYLESLQNTEVLTRLDGKPDHDFERGERLRRVLRPICHRPAEEGNETVIGLGHCREFMRDLQRVHALIATCGGIRKPSTELLDFLDGLATPDSWQLNVVIPVFAEMRSPAACDRLEKRFHSSVASIAEKKGWLTHDLIRFRNDRSVVALYKRLIMSNALDPKLREIALDTLFSYRPDVWYRPNTSGRPKPPNRAEASTEVLMELVRIADLGDKLVLPKNVIAGVKEGRAEIERVLAFRRSGEPERVARLISDLDHTHFPERQKAFDELARIGKSAEVLLLRAARTPRSAEARARLDSLLEKLTVRERDEDIAELIADLDSKDRRPAVRRFRAIRELRQYGEFAGPALWRTLQATNSPTLRMSLEMLLGELDR